MRIRNNFNLVVTPFLVAIFSACGFKPDIPHEFPTPPPQASATPVGKIAVARGRKNTRGGDRKDC